MDLTAANSTLRKKSGAFLNGLKAKKALSLFFL